MATTRKRAILRQVGRATVITLAWALLLAAIAAQSAPAQTFKSLYSFTGGNDGGGPLGPFAIDAEGNLYSATAYSQNGIGGGTVFKLSQAGKLSVLHSFTGGENGDGANDSSGVIRDLAGDIYGTTQTGGFNNQGVVFKVTKSGKESVLHRFTGGSDGMEPTAGLVRDSAGNLYGTTGGGARCVACGTVFKVDKAGKETVLYRFKGAPDAAHVLFGNLFLDGTGNLFGVTYYGGLTTGCAAPQLGCGTVFEVSPNGRGGWSEKVFYRFKGGAAGAYAYSGLVRDANGNFYGTTEWGGNSGCSGLGCGTVYKLDSSGNETVLYRFTGGSDGQAPGEVLILDGHGNLYGTASEGAKGACSDGCGTVFKLDTTGKLTVLHSFSEADGAHPLSLLRDTAGNLYGTTSFGGSSNWGTVFEIVP